MAGISKPKAILRGRTSSNKMLGVQSVRKSLVSEPAQVFYKAAKAGTDENDLVHILVPGLYEGPRLVEPIDIRIGETINLSSDNEGIVVMGVQVGRVDRNSLGASLRGKGFGQVVIRVDRDPLCSLDDAVRGITSHILPQIQIGDVKYVTKTSDLPGNSTGRGPGNRPPKGKKRTK